MPRAPELHIQPGGQTTSTQELPPGLNPVVDAALLENVLPLLEESMSPEAPPSPLSTHVFKRLKVPTIEEIVSSLRNGASVIERPFVIIYNINRLFRNTFRALGGLIHSNVLLNICTGLGMLNAFGIAVDGKNMLDHALMVFAPNRTLAQRAASLIDALKSAAWVIGDLAIMMSALIVWVHSTPAMQAFAACGKYFVLSAFLINIVKHVVDLCFYYQLKNELEGDVDSKINYATFKEDWDKRINNYNVVLRTLLIIIAPDFLKTLNELDTHLKANKMIDDGSGVSMIVEGEEKEAPILDHKVNEQVRYALLGRVKDKIFVKKVELIANLADTIAIAIFIAMPPAGAFVAPTVMGINFIITTGLWGIRFFKNDKSVQKFDERMKNAAKMLYEEQTLPGRSKFTNKENAIHQFLKKKMDENEEGFSYSHPKTRKLHREEIFLRGVGSLLTDLEKKGYTLEPLSDKHRTDAIKMVIKMETEEIGDQVVHSFGYYPRRFPPRKPQDRGWVSTTEWVVVPRQP